MTPPVMLFAAGRGERLRPLTDHTPKPLIAVAGEPLIARQLHQLAAAGVTDVIINLHHLGAQIEAFVGNGKRFGLHVRYSREAEKLETGGGLYQALPLLGDGPIWLLNGDVLFDLPLHRFPTVLPERSDLHLLLTPRPAARERGDFDFDGARVTGWGDGYVYTGLGLIDGAFFRRFAEALLETPGVSAAFSMRRLFETLVAEGRLTGSRYDGSWIDIGSPEQLAAANALLADSDR